MTEQETGAGDMGLPGANWPNVEPSFYPSPIHTVTHHIQENQRYKIVIERAASTKGVDGFKVEVNSDNLEEAKREVEELYNYAKRVTTPLSIAPALEK